MRYLNVTTLILPGTVLLLTLSSFISSLHALYLAAISIGTAEILVVAYREIRKGSFALDYIAFLAMLLAVYTESYLAGAIIALMYTGGEALETFATHRAEASLAALLARLPKVAIVKNADGTLIERPLAEVLPGTTIVIRRGELVPLDGLLTSARAVLTLANLTGEPLPENVFAGAVVKSGSVNAGEAFELKVSGTVANSTYAKIIDLVKDAENDQAPFVRLTARANIPFTLLTLGIGGCTYVFTGDVFRVLAVLVIATPCPLIIAAPVAFIGGLSRAAGRNIIVKTPIVLETIARVTTIFFDKTGTLTLGEPRLTAITCLDAALSETQALSLAAALEFHSIHPLARAVMTSAREHHFTPVPATNADEIIGTGISGTVEGRQISLTQAPEEYHRAGGIALLLSADNRPIAVLNFTDILKDHTKKLLADMAHAGYAVAVLTGDRRENAEAIFTGIPVKLYSDCTPDEKYRIVDAARAEGKIVAMIGDGLNDAPALARADVGVVFSGTENSASIEAADVAILGHDVGHIQELFALSQRSVRIARQSVFAGIGLSVVGMLIAAGGYITPVGGALLQEGIDIAVIINALRAAFTKRW